MSRITFKDEDEFEAAIAERISVAVLESYSKENDDLRAQIDKLGAEIVALKTSSKNITSDEYAPFAVFPELQALLQKAHMRPTSLPALVSLAIWKSSARATTFPGWVWASDILPTIPAGKKGDRDLVTVTRALENASAAFLAANTGLGIKVEVIRGTVQRPASAKARIFRFRAVEEVVDIGQNYADDAKERDRQDAADAAAE